MDITIVFSIVQHITKTRQLVRRMRDGRVDSRHQLSKITYGVCWLSDGNLVKGELGVVDDFLSDIGKDHKQDDGYQNGDQENCDDSADHPEPSAFVKRSSPWLDNIIVFIKLIIISLVLPIGEVGICRCSAVLGHWSRESRGEARKEGRREKVECQTGTGIGSLCERTEQGQGGGTVGEKKAKVSERPKTREMGGTSPTL